jgi:hypothetical protein
MKRSMFGTLSLAAALLVACSGDPTADSRKGANLVVTPAFLQINQGTVKTVTVQVLDDQGNALPATYSATSNNGAVAQVAESIGFRPGLGKNRLSSLFNVSGLQLDSTSLVFTSGNQTVVVPVQLQPANPAVNEVVTMTANGFKFLPTTRIVFGGIEQQGTQVAADSNSLTFIASNPGTNAALDIRSIAVFYLTSVGLNLPSAAPVSFGPAIIPHTGTDAIATAPEPIQVPADGSTQTVAFTAAGSGFTASPDCLTGAGGGFPCMIYKFTLPVDREFDLSTDWGANGQGTDLGFYFADATNAEVHAACDANGAGSTYLESCTVTLEAGTYYLKIVSFAAFYPAPFDVPPPSVLVRFRDHQ